MTATQQSMDAGSPTLARNAIGLTEVLFQCITHMAPAVATAISIGAATSFAGGITPLAVLFAMIAVLFTAYSMSELARHLPSAGGMYTYVSRGLGSFFGWLMAWSFALAEPSNELRQLPLDKRAELLRDDFPELPAISDLIEVLHNDAHSDPAFVPKDCTSVSM